MTQDHISGFASELVKMAQAMARVPELEAALETAAMRNLKQAEEMEYLKGQLEASRRYAAGLEQAKHDAEASRDDAELRFLEADDAKTTLERVLDGLGKDILGALQAVAPIPTSVTERTSAQPQTQSAQTWVPLTHEEVEAARGWIYGPPVEHPVSAPMMEALCVDAPIAPEPHITEWPSALTPAAGQSEADPTAPVPNTSTSVDTSETQGNAPSSHAASGEGVSVSPSPTELTGTIQSDGGRSTSTEGVSVSSDPTSSSAASNAAIEGGALPMTTVFDMESEGVSVSVNPIALSEAGTGSQPSTASSTPADPSESVSTLQDDKVPFAPTVHPIVDGPSAPSSDGGTEVKANPYYDYDGPRDYVF